jgi:hypothetical protein
MHHAASDILTGSSSAGHRRLHGRHSKASLHAVADGVADDAVGEHVFNRAQVQLAFGGAVLGDVGQPQLVGRRGGEVSLHQVVMDRRARSLAVLAPLHAEG